jgi:MscS family membrane protein
MLSPGRRSRGSSRMVAIRLALVVALAAMLGGLPAIPAHALDNDPLKPPDTTSPRATMRSFIDGSYAAYRVYLEEKLRTRGGLGTMDNLRRAVRTLDLSEVPPALVDDVGLESTLLLKEVIDRIKLPPTSAIPGDDADPPPDKWSIPNTEITIARVKDGPRAGEYLFSPETVKRAHEFYERVKHLPYQPGASERFYELYVFAPGWMLPYEWVDALPAWLQQGYHEQARWQWVALGLVVLAGVAIMALALLVQRRLARGPFSIGWSQVIFPLTGIVVIKAGSYFIEKQINIAGQTLDYLKISLDILFYVFLAFLIVAMSSIAVNLVIRSHRRRPKSIDTHLVRVSLRIVMIALIALVILHVTSSIGIPITPVLAGLGVGGLAVALAAQSTIENVIGGLTLFGDRPVRVGEFCRFGDTLGTVEEIGLRSTRIRTLERTVVTVPNAEFSKMELENLNLRDQMLLRTTLGLRYETTAEQLRGVLAELYELLRAHPKVAKEPLWVRFAGFGAYSLDVEIFAYIDSRARPEFLAIREEIFLRVMDLIDAAGTGFAFPSETHYLAQDPGLKAAQGGRPPRATAALWRSRDLSPPAPDADELTAAKR